MDPPSARVDRPASSGLSRVYGAAFERFVPLDAGGPISRQALLAGDVDVALLFTTDPAITQHGLVELVDDRHLQPAENVTPLVRAEVVDRWGAGLVAGAGRCLGALDDGQPPAAERRGGGGNGPRGGGGRLARGEHLR